MKTTINKKFDSVKYMREERQKLSGLLANMTQEEIVAYFRQKKTLNTVKPSA